MKLRLTEDPFPPNLDWRWSRPLIVMAVAFTATGGISFIFSHDRSLPVTLIAIAALLLAVAFRERALRLAKRLRDQPTLNDETQRLAVMGASTAGLAHELKNTVLVMQGFLELARNSAGTGENVDEHLASVAKQIDLAKSELEGFLSLAEEDRGTRPITDAINEAVALLGPLARLKGIRMESHLASGLDRLVREPGFRRALINLGLNAVAAASQSVRISASGNGASIVVAVEDDGPGLDKVIPGFGLVQVRKAVSEGEGGSLNQANLEPQGARFTIELPVSANRSHPTPHVGGQDF